VNSKEFIKNVKKISEEKNIDPEIIFEAMEQALMLAYKKNYNSKTNVKTVIDRKTGDIKIYSYYIVVEDYEDPEVTIDEEGKEVIIEPKVPVDAQLLLEDAKEMDPTIEIGETIQKEVTPKDFGRVAVQIAKQVLIQKIRSAEKDAIIDEFKDKAGELMLGTLAMEDKKNYYVDFGRARGILPKKELIPGEKLVMGSSVKVYINKIAESTKGPVISCTRKHFNFVKRLFELEIPEFSDGTLIMHRIVREPGIRSKVAISSTDPNVDAIGACIGDRGSRIANIYNELNGEKVDLVLYSDDPEEFIKKAMTPAKNVFVTIYENDEEKKNEALVIVSDEDLSIAIGKNGVNIKLASKLTKYHLTIKSMSQINEEGNEIDEK